jgi:hypothetical protein
MEMWSNISHLSDSPSIGRDPGDVERDSVGEAVGGQYGAIEGAGIVTTVSPGMGRAGAHRAVDTEGKSPEEVPARLRLAPLDLDPLGSMELRGRRGDEVGGDPFQ